MEKMECGNWVKMWLTCVLFISTNWPLTRSLSMSRDRLGQPRISRQSYTDDPLNDPTVIQTSTGLLRGLTRTYMDSEIHAYLGVPFAKPPVGELRFRKPVEPEPWEGVYNATSLSNSCMQERYEYFPGFEGEEMWNPNTNVSEDCLYMNIWVPKKARLRHQGNSDDRSGGGSAKGVPILVWIYGGGYMSGTATLDVYDADIMAAECNCIIASMQYRVGAFGFLFLKQFFDEDNEDAPGNMGLWDQVMAIKWLKDNAKVMGGDPELVTMFGESAGGGSVSLHLISPATRGLVRRGVLQSGTLNAPWSYMSGEKALDISRKLVEDCKCNRSLLEENPAKAMSCMRDIDAKTISVQQWNSYGGILGFPYGPTIDGVFMTKDPLDMVREETFDKTEVIIGNNENEGSYFLLYDFIDYFEKDNPSPLDRSKFRTIINTIFKNMTKVERDSIAFQYTDWKNIKDDYMYQQQISDCVGDYYFICPSINFAQLFADRGMKVYYYYFKHRTSTNLWGQWMGVMHGDEIEYVFGQPLNRSLEYSDSERDLARRMILAFSTFSYHGKPEMDDVEWPEYTRDNPNYYIFNTDPGTVLQDPRTTYCAFWNDFMPQLKGLPDTSVYCENDPSLVVSSIPAVGEGFSLVPSLTLLFLLAIAHIRLYLWQF